MVSPERPKILIAFALVVLVGCIAAPIRGQDSIKITGSAVDPNSVPIPGAHLTLYSLDRILQTVSDSQGRFQFDDVRPATYEFEALAPGFKRAVRLVDLTGMLKTASKDKPLELTAPMQIGPSGSPVIVMSATVMGVAPAGTCGSPVSVAYDRRKAPEAAGLSGIAIEQYGKQRISAATVQLFDTAGVQAAHQETNDSGEFHFKQIAPGRYHLVLLHSGYDPLTSLEFWVARENTTYLTLRPVPTGKVMLCQ